MTFDESLEQALRSPEPLNELRALALHLFEQGQAPRTVLELFEGARQRLRQANRDADEDLVTDCMDFLVGWCSPHMKLPPDAPPGPPTKPVVS
jgi:hypothetical protein